LSGRQVFQNYRGAIMGWTRFLGNLETVVARLD
jgi:hypothetical protein